MKLLILLALCVSAQSFACSCSKYAKGINPSVIEHLGTKLGVNIADEDITINKYYPTAHEKRSARKEPMNSCLTQIANAPFHMCARRRKADVQVEITELGCTAQYKVITNSNKATVKEISSSCN